MSKNRSFLDLVRYECVRGLTPATNEVTHASTALEAAHRRSEIDALTDFSENEEQQKVVRSAADPGTRSQAF
jgi:hypothetical protein